MTADQNVNSNPPKRMKLEGETNVGFSIPLDQHGKCWPDPSKDHSLTVKLDKKEAIELQTPPSKYQPMESITGHINENVSHVNNHCDVSSPKNHIKNKGEANLHTGMITTATPSSDTLQANHCVALHQPDSGENDGHSESNCIHKGMNGALANGGGNTTEHHTPSYGSLSLDHNSSSSSMPACNPTQHACDIEDAYNAFVTCSDNLITALSVDPLSIVNTLVAKKFLPPKASDEVLLPSYTPHEKATRVVNAIRAVIKVNAERFHEFIRILSNEPWTKDIVEILQSAYQGRFN